MKLSYNFRLGPEAIWLAVNTVVATALIQITQTDFVGMTDLGGWATGFGIGLLSRTVPAAILAAAAGSFIKPGEAAPASEYPAADDKGPDFEPYVPGEE